MGLSCWTVLILLSCLHLFCKVARKKACVCCFQDSSMSYGAKSWTNCSYREQKNGACSQHWLKCTVSQEAMSRNVHTGCGQRSGASTEHLYSLSWMRQRHRCSLRCQVVLVKCSKTMQVAMLSACGAWLFWSGFPLSKRGMSEQIKLFLFHFRYALSSIVLRSSFCSSVFTSALSSSIIAEDWELGWSWLCI